MYSSKIRLDASARKLIPRLTGRVIDVGSGGQPYRRYLAGDVEYVSMELSESSEADVIGSVLSIPLDDQSFDGIICTEVIEHVEDPQLAIKELNRVSKGGGLLYLTAPMSWGLHYEPYDYFRYTKYGLASMLERGGYRVVEARQIGGVFVMAWARISDVLVSLLYRAGFPLKYVLGSQGRTTFLSLIAFPFVALGDALASLADLIVPGSHRDALGWIFLAEKTGDPVDK